MQYFKSCFKNSFSQSCQKVIFVFFFTSLQCTFTNKLFQRYRKGKNFFLYYLTRQLHSAQYEAMLSNFFLKRTSYTILESVLEKNEICITLTRSFRVQNKIFAENPRDFSKKATRFNRYLGYFIFIFSNQTIIWLVWY